jgi:hypothetical protein
MEGTDMTIRTATVPAPRSQQPVRRSRLALAIVGAGMLALVGVFAARQGSDDPAATTTAPVPAAPASVAAPSPSYTVYLTDSAEQATALARDLALLTPAFGEPIPGEVLTLAAGSLEEMDRARYIISTLEDATSGRGVYVVDTRRPVTAARPGAGGGCEDGLGSGATHFGAC